MENNRAKIYRDDGDAFQRWGSLDEAERCYLKALDHGDGSKDHQTLCRMAELSLEKKNPQLALEYYMLAIRADRGNSLYKQRFLDISGTLRFECHNADVEDVLLECLKTPGLDFSDAGPLWLTILLSNPEFVRLYRDRQLFEKKFDTTPLLRPYFLEGLKKIPIADIVFEDFIRRLRQWLLMGFSFWHNGPRTDFLRLTEAVAIYGVYSGYLAKVTAAEQAKLREIAVGQFDLLFSAAITACYGLENVANIFEPSSALALALKEREQIKTEDVPAALPGNNEEGAFYSPWRTIPVHTLTTKLFFPPRKEKLERTFAGTRPELLVAGCGTGREALMAGLYYPKGKITAIDPRRENIAYATLKSRAYDLSNITFRQDDIPALAKVPQAYDIIYSTGVLHYLHYMAEPLKAWRILWDNLKPAGVMKIGLASKTALRSVIEAREVIRKFNIGNNRESILDFRTRSAELLPPATLENLSRLRGYHSFPAYGDLLFHPGLHFYTLPEIEESLTKLRLRFEGFDLPATVLQQYADKFPADPEMISLKNWHIFEQEAPDTFAGLYQFWCRKI